MWNKKKKKKEKIDFYRKNRKSQAFTIERSSL